MAPNFQSSFIPKESVVETGFQKKSVGLLGFIAVCLLVVSILASIGLYVYKRMVTSDIASLKTELVESEKNIDKKTIDDMSVFSKKLDVVRSIVYKHQAVSNVLDILASSTISSVYFTDFNYERVEPNGLNITLHGKAINYGSIASEESILIQNKYFKKVTFSNLGLVDGGVSFELLISVDPEAAIYTKQASSIIIPTTLPITTSTIATSTKSIATSTTATSTAKKKTN